ncbi:putative ribonuclease H-like domain-containing protein [Tanacetum coccineum]
MDSLVYKRRDSRLWFENTLDGTFIALKVETLVLDKAQENGASVTKMLVPVTAKEKTNKKNDMKARSLLLMALPNEHQPTFSQYTDAKIMFVAIETRFGDFRRLLVGLQFWMNKAKIKTMSIDDLYNNFKIVEQSLKKSVGTSSGAQNLAFMIAPSTSSTNDVNTTKPAYEVSTTSPNVNTGSPQVSTASLSDNVVYAFMVDNPNGSNLLQQDLKQIHEDDLKDTLSGSEEHQGTKKVSLEIKITQGSMETMKTHLQRKSSKDLDKLLGSQITDKSKKGLGYSVVPLPHPLIYNQPKKLDLSYSGKKEFNIVCDKKSDDSKENSDDSLVKEQVLEHTSSFVESSLNVNKETIFLDKNIEFVKPKNHEKSVKMSVRIIVNTIKGKGWQKAVKTARLNSAVVNVVRVNQENVVKASTCWVWRPTKPDSASITLKKLISFLYVQGKPLMDDKGFVDSGCSRHMTGNISYLSDIKEIKGGYITFGEGAHSGRISGKGTLKTYSLDFEDVYFVNELKFNLFIVLQMCDKKNYVLFTDTKCLLLSPNFKFPDETHILLKIPRKDNMYNFDMKNIVHKESLTCLVAKATLDESMLWHRRLGHINFKNINKLGKDNLVRGLSIKRFENDQTYVVCLKGKQHIASC